MKKKTKIILSVIAALVLVMGVAFTVYVNIYYHADDTAMKLLEDPASGITVTSANDRIVFESADSDTGIIFYPGGKVQYEAYAPLMEQIALRGITVVLLHMPFNLAVFDVNAADGIMEDYPDIDTWYMAGHSLGGAMAATYLYKNQSDYAGLILLAAYSTKDLSDSGLKVLSIYGSEDGVLARDTYKENLKNLPEDYTEHVIEGGCHAYFGSYGAQKKDGTPTITADEQWQETAEVIYDFINDAS